MARLTDPAPAGGRWLHEVGLEASRAAGDLPVELIGDYLALLADVAATGRKPKEHEFEAVGELGGRAAELGVSVGDAVQLYLSAAWRLWRDLPRTAPPGQDGEAVRGAAEAVLRVIDRSVARLTEGHVAARRAMMRGEQTLRMELIEDLLRGDGDLGGLVARAQPFGMDMAQPHQVALAAPAGRLGEDSATITSLERAVVQWLGDRDVLVAPKDGWIVVIAPSQGRRPAEGARHGAAHLGDLIHRELGRARSGEPWRISTGRPYPGVYGIARSYEEAREALTTSMRLRLDTPVIHADQLLIYRVLVRDQPAITDLVQTLVGPLAAARGGAGPLLDTLDAYFAAGCVVTEAARRLHLSVRAVTYRLDRVAALTGHDPRDPAQRFTLHTAVLGAQLLGWPPRAQTRPRASIASATRA